MKTRILIVDDHKIFRDALRTLIDTQRDMEVVGEAGDGQHGIEMARRLSPDVVLMDVKMPVMDGIEATRRILAEVPGTKVLALTMYDDERFLSGIMDAGASGYILKGGDFQELSEAIRRAANPGHC